MHQEVKQMVEESKSSFLESTSEILTSESHFPCESVPQGEIPRCFDWRNVNGINYDSPVEK